MPIVDTTVPITAQRCDQMIRQIVQAYPFCRSEVLTTTAFQRPVPTLVIGQGPRKARRFHPLHRYERGSPCVRVPRQCRRNGGDVESDGRYLSADR